MSVTALLFAPLLLDCTGGSRGFADAGDAASVADVSESDGGNTGPVLVTPDRRFPTSTLEDYSLHPEFGLPCSRTRVVVSFDQGTTTERAREVLEAAGAEVAGERSEMGLFLARVPDPGDHSAVDTLIAALEGTTEVEAAALDALLSAGYSPGSSTHTPSWEYQGLSGGGTVGDANYSLERHRVPVAWNLLDYINSLGADPVTVMVVDSDFTSDADLPFASFYGVPPGQRTHGSEVASILGSSFGNGAGIDPIAPAPIRLIGVPVGAFTWIDPADPVIPWSDLIDLLPAALASYPDTKVLNLSVVYDWDETRNANFDPATDPRTISRIAAQARQLEAVVVWATTQSPTQLTQLVFVAAAGNDSDGGGPVIDGRYGSPACYAIREGWLQNGLCVAAASSEEGPLPSSNRPADIFAPGEAVGTLTGPAGVSSGTSFAAPFVAGTAVLLYQLRPSATAAEVISALRAGVSLLPWTETAPLLDVFAAVMAFDVDNTLLGALVDTDDGTLDGSTRVRLTDDGEVIYVPVTEDEQGDGAVDMRDLRRFRDALRLVQNGGDWLNGIEEVGYLDKLDVNRDGEQTTEPPSSLFLPPGIGTYQWENIWSRFDFNGDGLTGDATRRYPSPAGPTDVEVMAQVWGQVRGTSEADREGWTRGNEAETAAMLARLLESADVEIRVANMFADPRFPSFEEVEVHVWVEPDEEPERGDDDERSRRLARDDGEALVFTVPISGTDTVRVAAYYVVDPNDPSSLVGAEVTESDPDLPPRLQEELTEVVIAEDHVAVFGPYREETRERYVYYWFNKLTFEGDVRVVEPDGTSIDLLDPIPFFQNGGGPPGISCSVTGEHVAFRSFEEVFLYTADGDEYTYSIPVEGPAIDGGTPVFSDDRSRMVWVWDRSEDESVVQVRDTLTQEERTLGPWADVSPGWNPISMTPDGRLLLVSNAVFSEYTALFDWISDGLMPQLTFIIDLETGEAQPAYNVERSAVCDEVSVHDARVQIGGASFTPSGTMLFGSDEPWVNSSVQACTDPDYEAPPGLGIELGMAAPRGTATSWLTTLSGETDGLMKSIPILSPDGSRILFQTTDQPGPITSEVRMLLLGNARSTILHEIESPLEVFMGLCWLRNPR